MLREGTRGITQVLTLNFTQPIVYIEIIKFMSTELTVLEELVS